MLYLNCYQFEPKVIRGGICFVYRLPYIEERKAKQGQEHFGHGTAGIAVNSSLLGGPDRPPSGSNRIPGGANKGKFPTNQKNM